jgi:WD40 repeat protein
VYSVAFSPDSKRIASGSYDTTVRLWDSNTGQPIGQPITGHRGKFFGMTRVAFSPDGKLIVSGSVDDTVRLWNAATGQPIGDPLIGHNRAVVSVAFSPDGTRFASGSNDHTVRLWPTYPDPASAVCVKLTANMSHPQWRDWLSPDIGYINVCPDLPFRLTEQPLAS